jgi:hypothetical protein
VIAVKRFAGRKEPVDHKSFLKMGNHWPCDSKMNVLDGTARRFGQQVRRVDVQATRKSNAAIDDKQLSMITKIGVLKTPWQGSRHESSDRNLMLSQQASNRWHE